MQSFEAYQQWMEELKLPVLLTLGVLIVFGRLFAILFEKMRLPSIVGLLVAGVLLGVSGFNFINTEDIAALSFLSNLALGFVALSLGLEFKMVTIRSLGAGIGLLIICECFLTFLLVAAGMWAVSGSLPFGLAAGAVGAASAPTSALAIASEFKARGPLTSAIFAITGFDDAVSIVIFSFASTLAATLYAQSNGYNVDASAHSSMLHNLVFDPLMEVGLALVIGMSLGFLYRLLTRRVDEGHMLLLWILGMMFLVEGISFLLEYSLILSNMVMGAVIINQISSLQAAKLLRSMETLMPVVFVLFFVFAGAQLDVLLVPTIGLAGLVYIICRTLGKFLGASTGASLARLPHTIRRYSWAGLLSQVGVGLGLAMILIEKFRPLGKDAVAMGQQLLVIVTATSIFFEVIAPVLTKWALLKAGEIKVGADGRPLLKAEQTDESNEED